MLQESRGEQVPGTKMAWRFSEGGMIELGLTGLGEVQARAKGRGRNDLAQGWAEHSMALWARGRAWGMPTAMATTMDPTHRPR